MKEYAFEDGPVDITKLRVGRMDQDAYEKKHAGSVLACHDVFIQYENGILLVKRLNSPAKGLLWPIGGEIYKGFSTEDSLREKAMDEANLELEKIVFLGTARTFFKTDPFGHGKGTDSSNLVYFAKGRGTLQLNNLHEKPTIVMPDEYDSIRKELFPYIQDFMDIVIKMVE